MICWQEDWRYSHICYCSHQICGEEDFNEFECGNFVGDSLSRIDFIRKGKKKLFFRLLTPFILKHSDRIIAISDFVKQDILKTYPFVSADKIAVIHNGVVLPSSGLSRSLQSDSKYLLYISTLHEYKNVGTLVKAFIELKDTISHKLVVVGKSTDYWEKEILPIIVESGIQDRIVHLSHYVSE